MMSRKVVIDTDIGDDIDDALALALALSSPELEVVGVTTVYGRVDVRALLAARVLQAFDREDTPVLMGCRKPLLGRIPEHIPNQAGAVEERGFSNIGDVHASDFIEDFLAREEEPLIITLGPLTNIALVLAKRPELADKARLVVMGGYVSYPRAEYNVRCDPEAASIVLESGAHITLVGLDVTLRCKAPDRIVEGVRSGRNSRLRVLADMLDLWTRATHGTPILHDPLAVAVSYRRGLVKATPMRVAVELHGKHTRGATVPLAGGRPNVEACIDVSVEKFMELYEERVLA